MAARNTLHGKGQRRRSDHHTSVVGSKVGDTGRILLGRRLPRGGIREGSGLSVADGALPDSTSMGRANVQETGISVLRAIAIVCSILLVILVVVAIAFAILAHTSAFVIDSVEAVDTEHAKAEDIVRLVTLEEGATLLSVDEAAVREAVLKNPWIESIAIERVFPGTLRIHATERTPRALVAMGTGGIAWLLGSDGHWIEPVSLEVGEGEATRDAALAKAGEYGADLITNVPTDVAPVAGSSSTDESVLEALSFEEQFSQEFAKQVVSYSAPGRDDISCVLSNGVEVALGSATNVLAKEQIVQNVLGEYGGKVTYINVRVPSRPTFRYVDSPYVREGTGANGEPAVEERTQEHVGVESSNGQGEDKTTSGDQSELTDGEDLSGMGQEGYTDSSAAGQDGGMSDQGAASGLDSYGYDDGTSATYANDGSYGQSAF